MIATEADFSATLEHEQPPVVPPVLVALWWAGRGDWHRAHETVQDLEGREAAWVHAHLHRQEGDLDNARYWYRRAGRRPREGALEAEWKEIVRILLR